MEDKEEVIGSKWTTI